MKPLIVLIMENAEMICRLAGIAPENFRVVIDGKVYRYVGKAR